jgi:hypothetical protein
VIDRAVGAFDDLLAEPFAHRASEKWRAEDRVSAGGDRCGDGEDVVDEERRAADHAEAAAEQFRGDDVPSAARREVLDDARVRVRDDEDGDRGAEREADGEGCVIAIFDELTKRVVRAVRR